jgi:hypothetical protein
MFIAPLPEGEVESRSNSGEGLQHNDRAYPLTPTLSPWERERGPDDEARRAQLGTLKIIGVGVHRTSPRGRGRIAQQFG